MGFRKLVFFNKSLLVKQVWRMICESNSLTAHLFKSRYFKHTDVMDAGIGSNPSYIWRSLCWSHELLELGLRWRIYDGNIVQIYQDAWIPSLTSDRLLSCIALSSTVGRFIMADSE